MPVEGCEIVGRKLRENPLCLRPDATNLAEAPPSIMLRGACEVELVEKSRHGRTFTSKY